MTLLQWTARGIAMGALVFSISACGQEGADMEKEADQMEQPAEQAEHMDHAEQADHSATAMHAKTVKVSIDGMTCSSCVKSVDEALAGIDGVSEKNVSLEDNQCTVTFDPAKTDEKSIVAAIEKLEYKAEVMN